MAGPASTVLKFDKPLMAVASFVASWVGPSPLTAAADVALSVGVVKFAAMVSPIATGPTTVMVPTTFPAHAALRSKVVDA